MSSFSPTAQATGQGLSFVRAPITGDGSSEASKEFRPIRAGREGEDDPQQQEKTSKEIREEAYAEGVAAGRAELPWQEVEEVRSLIDLLAKLMDDVACQQRDGLLAQRKCVTELALTVAETLVRRTIEQEPEALVGVVERAISALPDQGKLAIAISSEDYAALQAGVPDALAHLGQDGLTEFEASSDLARGDVRVSGATGEVDARVSSLVARVREQLVELETMSEEGR